MYRSSLIVPSWDTQCREAPMKPFLKSPLKWQRRPVEAGKHWRTPRLTFFFVHSFRSFNMSE